MDSSLGSRQTTTLMKLPTQAPASSRIHNSDVFNFLDL